MQLTKNIASYELLPKSFHNNYGRSDRAVLRLMDARIVMAQQWLINRFGSMYMNNWYWGGDKQERGFRPFNSSVGAMLSQHKYGRAIDSVPKKVTIQDIHSDILQFEQSYIEAGFTCFECIWDAPTWIHGDCRWHNVQTEDYNGLLFVDYSGNAYTLEEYRRELRNRNLLS